MRTIGKFIAATLVAAAAASAAGAATFDPDRARQGLPSLPTPPAATAPQTPGTSPASQPQAAAAPAAPAGPTIVGKNGCVLHPISIPIFRSSVREAEPGRVPTFEQSTFLLRLEELNDKGVPAASFTLPSNDFLLGAHAKGAPGIGKAAYKISCLLKATETGTYVFGLSFKTPAEEAFYARLGGLTGPSLWTTRQFVTPDLVKFPHVAEIRVEGRSILKEKRFDASLGATQGQDIVYTASHEVLDLRGKDASGRPADRIEVEIFFAADVYIDVASVISYDRSAVNAIRNELMGLSINLKTPSSKALVVAPTDLLYHEVRGETVAPQAPSAPPTPAAPAGGSTGGGQAPANQGGRTSLDASPSPAATSAANSSTGGASAPSSASAPTAAPASTASAPTAPSASAAASTAPSAASAAPTKRPDTLVKAVQEKLNALGYDAGTADGELGPNTTASVKRFQEAAGLSANGKIDAALLEKLYAADKGTLRLDHGIAMGASGLPNSFLSKLTKSQISKLNLIVGVALGDHSDPAPFPFVLASDGNLTGRITLTGSPTDACRTYVLAASLPSGASGKSARPQNACKVGSAWKLSS